jgi:MurNAc alpha-1-phosphate uridylyltransferase
MTLPLAILAGGLATRLYPMSKTIPKSLIRICGKPFIDWQLEYLKKEGIQRVILCLGYLGEQIQTYLGNGERFGLELAYSFDGSLQLGTGGALKQALPLLDDEFFVLYGDSYLPITFSEVEDAFSYHRKDALMTIINNKNQWDTSNVCFENGILLEYNKQEPKIKMNYIDYGLSILSASLLVNYPSNEPFDLADLYHECSIQNNLFGHEVFSRFYEIGSPQGLRETTLFLSKSRL